VNAISLAPLQRATAALVSRRWFRWIGYPSYFLFCLVAFGYFTFPYERVRERVRTEMESNLNADVEIEDLSPSWVTGVELTGVDIDTRPRREGEKGSHIRLDSVTARVSLLSLVVGGVDVSFAAELLGGEIDGEASQDGEAGHVVLEWSDLDLSQMTIVKDAIGLPVKGILSGEADLQLPGSKLAASGGTIQIVGEGLEVGDGSSKLQLPGMPGDGISVDAIRVGSLRGDLRVTEGNAEIQRMTSTSRDLEMIWEGSMRLRDPFPMSSLTAYVRFKFGDSYKNRSERTKSLFELLDMVPRMRQAKRPDGFFGYRVGGSFDRGLTFTPSTRGAAHAGGRVRDRPTRPKRLPRSRPTEEPPQDEAGGNGPGVVGPPDDSTDK
jgi:type II secretion system protein N